MTAAEILSRVGCSGAVHARPVGAGQAAGHRQDEPVTPASVMKVQIALAVLTSIEEGRLDGRARVRLPRHARTPGPVGLSLLDDDADLSLRDLVALMLTLSDNVATDALLARVGIDAVNRLTSRCGLRTTAVRGDLTTMLDTVARELGSPGYAELIGDDTVTRDDLAATTPLDPRHGSRTTARECTELLARIWTDQAAPPAACARVRELMGRQLTRHRIAAALPRDVHVAAKSGGLFGVVRNEVAVVTWPDGRAYAVAAFTRRLPGTDVDERLIDRAVGELALHALTDLGPGSGPERP